MPRLAVSSDNLLHLFLLRHTPQCIRHLRVRHDQLSAVNFVIVAVPKLLLLTVECLKKILGDHVFHADEAGALVWRVVNQTLANLLAEVCAVMVGLHMSASVLGIDVEAIEVCTNLLCGSEGLSRCGAGFEYDIFGAASASWRWMAVWLLIVWRLLWLSGVVLRLNGWDFVHGIVVFSAALWC